MVRIYYHIFAKNGVINILNEHFELIEKYFNFEYELNIGISYDTENNLPEVTEYLNNKKCIIRKVSKKQDEISEWATLNLIEDDKSTFADDDVILYFHTKGITRINDDIYESVCSWRQMLNYFLLERINDILVIFNNTDYNMYCVSKHSYNSKLEPKHFHMNGNFCALTGKYVKTIDTAAGDRCAKNDVENRFWQMGESPNVYQAYPFRGQLDFYNTYFKREDYEIKQKVIIFI
jgi:hypothetical protein